MEVEKSADLVYRFSCNKIEENWWVHFLSFSHETMILFQTLLLGAMAVAATVVNAFLSQAPPEG